MEIIVPMSTVELAILYTVLNRCIVEDLNGRTVDEIYEEWKKRRRSREQLMFMRTCKVLRGSVVVNDTIVECESQQFDISPRTVFNAQYVANFYEQGKAAWTIFWSPFREDRCLGCNPDDTLYPPVPVN